MIENTAIRRDLEMTNAEMRSPSFEVKAVRPFIIRNPLFSISPARRLAVMNLALRGIEAAIDPEHADTFRRAVANSVLDERPLSVQINLRQ